MQLLHLPKFSLTDPDGRSPVETVGSNPAGPWMSVCCVLSEIDLCDELITRPEKSYGL
jgi:hypothetical protein